MSSQHHAWLISGRRTCSKCWKIGASPDSSLGIFKMSLDASGLTKVAWDALPRSGGSARPRRGEEIGNMSMSVQSLQTIPKDVPTLLFCVSAQSVSICSLEWGSNSPLKQNMAIGAGVGRASRNICTSRTSRSGVKLNRIPHPVGPKKNPQDCSVNFISLLLGSTFSIHIRGPADPAPGWRKITHSLTVPSSGCGVATAHPSTGSGNQLIAVGPRYPGRVGPHPSPDRRRPSRRSLDVLLACLGI